MHVVYKYTGTRTHTRAATASKLLFVFLPGGRGARVTYPPRAPIGAEILIIPFLLLTRSSDFKAGPAQCGPLVFGYRCRSELTPPPPQRTTRVQHQSVAVAATTYAPAERASVWRYADPPPERRQPVRTPPRHPARDNGNINSAERTRIAPPGLRHSPAVRVTCAPPPEQPQHRDTDSNDRPAVPPLPTVTRSCSSTRLLYKQSE